ncbi:MAG: DUF1499 domain-containing protein [Alcanivoracaceae bacterium]
MNHWRQGLCGLFALIASMQVQAEQLPDCPDTPNCVSSQASSAERRVDPLPGGDNADDARERLIQVLDSLPRVTWRELSERLIRAEFTTRLLRFTDDVEFRIADDGLIHVRSASRMGYSDLGANRARVEDLRRRLAYHSQPE